MGRVSKVQALENRNLILHTACKMFRKYGVESVSIADIMHAVDLTVGGFYKHFESKDALINEAFKLTFEHSYAKWNQFANSNHRPDHIIIGQNLLRLVEHYLKDRPLEQNCPMLSFASQVSNMSDQSEIKQTYSKGIDDLYAKFESICQNNITATNGYDFQSETKLLFSSMIGIGMLKKATGKTELVEEMTDLLLKKIKLLGLS